MEKQLIEYLKSKTSLSGIYNDDVVYNKIEIKTKFLLDKEQDITKYIKDPKTDSQIFGNRIYDFVFNDDLKVLGIKSRYGSDKTTLLTKIINAK